MAVARPNRCGGDAVAALREVLDVTFGPAGQGVLFQRPGGELSISRAAIDVLEAAFPSPDPELSLLLSSGRALRELAGDGVKSLLLTAGALLESLRAAPAVRVVPQLRQLHAGLATASSQLPPAEPLDRPRVIATFLSTRFSPDVAAALRPVLTSWLSGGEDVVHLRRHFAVLCRYQNGGGRPVSDSAVRKGVLVSGAAKFLGDGSERRKLAVLPLSGEEDDEGVDIQSAVNGILDDSSEEELRQTLLVTSAVLSDLSLFRLRQQGAAVLQGVAREEERFLLDWTLGATGRRELKVEVRREPQGRRPGLSATWLGLDGVRQMVVHAPTPALAEQLARATRDALQLVTFARRSPLCPAGGRWERELHHAVLERLGPRGAPSLGRSELLSWHAQRSGFASGPSDPTVAVVASAMEALDEDTLRGLADAVAAVPRALSRASRSFRTDPVEPVLLRLAVLEHAVHAVLRLLSVDAVLSAKRDVPSARSAQSGSKFDRNA